MKKINKKKTGTRAEVKGDGGRVHKGGETKRETERWEYEVFEKKERVKDCTKTQRSARKRKKSKE